MPRLIGIEGLAAGSMFLLSAETIVIGSEGECDIVLVDIVVSRRHARLVRVGANEYAVRDLSSAIGVYLNARRVQEEMLVSGDHLKIGDSVFRYEQ